jgi:hypothetical protein
MQKSRRIAGFKKAVMMLALVLVWACKIMTGFCPFK